MVVFPKQNCERFLPVIDRRFKERENWETDSCTSGLGSIYGSDEL